MNAAWAELRDENDSVLFSDQDGYGDVVISELDTGAPATRAVTNDLPSRSGALDTSMFTSARAVSLTFTCAGNESSRRTFMSAVMPLIVPKRRPKLVVSVPEWGDTPWQLVLRADSFTAPLTIGSDINLTWQAPTGLWESTKSQTVSIPGVDNIPTGRQYARAYPYGYGTGSSQSSVVVHTDSPVETLPLIRLYGPVTNPVITNQTTGQAIVFNYAVTAGNYLSVDMDTGLILENDDPSASRFGKVQWANSSFWALQPGDNLIAFTGTGFSTVTQATMTWTEKRL